MKISCLLFLSFLLFWNNSKAQDQFQKSFSASSGYDEFYSVCKTPDNNYVYFGDALNTTTQFADLFVVKADPDGNVIWSKTFTDTVDVFGTKVICDSLGNIYLTGYTYYNTPPYDDIIFIKLDQNGNTLVQKLFVGGDIDEANDIVMDLQGNFVIVGYTYSFGSALKSGFALKVDESGALLWSSAYSQFLNQEFSGISVTDSNDYIFTGLIQLNSGINIEAYIVKVNTNGQLLWGESSGGLGTDVYYHSYLDRNGNIYVCGASNTGTTSGNLDGLVSIYTPGGVRINSTTYGTSAVDRTYNIVPGPLSGNEIILSGHSSNTNGLEASMELYIDKNSGVLNNYYLLGDANSSSRSFGMTFDGTTFSQVGYTLNPMDTAGSAFVIQHNYSDIPCAVQNSNFNLGNPVFGDTVATLQSVASPVSENLNLIENIGQIDTTIFCRTNSIANVQNSLEAKLFPNPAANKFVLEINNSCDKVRVKIVDSYGRVSKEFVSSDSMIEVDGADLSNGIYIVSITVKSKIEQIKLLISK